MTQLINSGRATGIVVGEDVHVLKPSRSSYAVRSAAGRQSYCCQDGCCDSGLAPDVADVVGQAKALGAQRVILRTGLNRNYVGEIHGLPVSDVSNHVGPLADGYVVAKG